MRTNAEFWALLTAALILALAVLFFPSKDVTINATVLVIATSLAAGSALRKG